MTKTRFFLSLKLQLLLFCLVVFIPIIFISRYFFEDYSRAILLEDMKSKLLAVTNIAAGNFQGPVLEKLSSNNFKDTKEYNQIRQKINKIKQANPFIRYCAIIIGKDNDRAFFLVDSTSKPYDFNKDGNISPNEGMNLLGDKANEIRISTETALKEGFNKAALSNIIYTDKFGSWIKAYAPVKGLSPNDNAVITIEMYLSNLNKENNDLNILFEKILVGSLFIILILLFIGLKIFLNPLKSLKQHISNIRKGNFDDKVPTVFYSGEIGAITEYINELSVDLQKAFQKSQEDKEKLEEMQKLIELTNQMIKSKNFQLNSTIVTLNSINELVEELISIKETQELMETVLPSTINLIKARKGFIVEYLPEEKNFKVMTSVNTIIIQPEMIISASESQILKKIFDTKNYINIDEAGEIKGEEYKTALIFPLLVEKEIKGLMFIMDKIEDSEKEENCFEESDEATVRTLSKLVAAVWESIHLFELATVDNLSKLYVRRYLEMNLEEEIKKAIRNHNELSIIMIDIDNLQKCNDNYGHFIGDQVIKLVAEKIKECTGEEDLAARYGGEKMVVLVNDKSPDAAMTLAEQIREVIEEIEVPVPIGDNLKITVSIGVAGFPDHGGSTEELIKSADEALYKAKREGKNKVILAGED
jgi:diguanylate cyclase (GGDEF)-like protein